MTKCKRAKTLVDVLVDEWAIVPVMEPTGANYGTLPRKLASRIMNQLRIHAEKLGEDEEDFSDAPAT